MTELERMQTVYDRMKVTGAERWDSNNIGNRLVVFERRSRAERLLAAAGWVPMGERDVLEVGCGGGGELAWLLELGADPSRLIGVDLLPERVHAACRAHPGLTFLPGNAESLEFPDSNFDLVLAITVFSSILDQPTATRAAAEIQRVLKPGGGLLWYDFRYDSPANSDVRGIDGRRVRELFGGLRGGLQTVTVLPPLVRRLGRLTPHAYPALATIPVLRTHLIGLLRKP